jgi:CBS domain-containing protein
MPYVSELIGKVVTDVDGARVGRLRDIIASSRENMPHPQVVAILVHTKKGPQFIPYDEVAVLVAPAIPLAHRLSAIKRFVPSASDIFLMRDILDQQIIDVNDVRVVRVNDVELARVNGTYYIANVDTGGTGLLRRLGLLRVVPGRSGTRPKKGAATGIISWDVVETLSNNRSLRLKVPGDKISELHPADLAEIISDLNRLDGSKFLESLDPKTAAEALEEVEPDFQASLVEGMPDKRVADVLEEMAPDEAADLLAELPEKRSKSLLGMMEKSEAADVRKLLTYAEDTAGGIMTTEYVTVASTRTAAQAMAAIRQSAHDAETIFYVYVTDKKNVLEGVLSLKDLVLAEPRMRVASFMHKRVVSVNLHDSQDDVAQVVSKYNLLAVPVVDDEGRMQGIVTVDDALDKIIPTAWKKRLPRLYH